MTTSEENYLKVIYHLSNLSPKGVNTNAIAAMLDTKASSVTDMLKKLSEKDWINYQKYQGVSLTDKGKLNARNMFITKPVLDKSSGIVYSSRLELAKKINLTVSAVCYRIRKGIYESL